MAELDLSTLTAEQQIAAIYIGYYDRAADPVGQNFWEGAVANPALSLADIASDFATQPETLNVHPFFDDPTPAAANAFITELYLNLFNREPDAAGLTFWSDALQAAIAGEEGSFSVGEIILEIIQGAQNSAEGQDLTTILNKIEVSNAWTDAAEAAGIDYTSDTGAQASAKSIIEGVTADGDTVSDAKSTISDYFVPTGVEGETLSFTSGTDNLVGTDDDDTFEGYLQQNPFAGGVSNGLSSADRADGGAGNDKLYAELVSEFVGGISGTENIDVQPRIKNIEALEFEARDIAQNAPLNFDIQDLLANRLDDLGFITDGIDTGDIDEFFGVIEGATGLSLVPSEKLIAGILDGWQRDIVVDAKNITGHDFLGSTFSDGDLMIENVNTLTSNGVARNTSEITIGMNHTDNANSDGDASDLTVYFDEDYLISGQQSEGKIFYFLLDEDAELAGNPNRLNNIDVDGIRFTIDTGNGPVEVNIEASAANVSGTHQGFVNALQDPLQALIADGTLPAGTTLTLDPTVTDFTFLDDGSQSDDIPAIVLTSGDGSEVIATGFSRIEEEIGEYDVYGRFNSENEVEDQPVSINIDLYKAGRGGEGGNLVIGGKDQSEAGDGIEVFNVNVKGDGDTAVVDQPSNIGTLTSTNNALRIINIKTDAMDAVKDSVASLTIRDGFNELYDGDSLLGRESGDLQLVNADAFLGDLNLGTDQRVVNLDTLTAQGGGDVTFRGNLNGVEVDQAYSYTTGGGDDVVDVTMDGDALDYNDSSLNVATGAGNDKINIDFDPDTPENTNNQQLNQAVLDNVEVDAGSGDDVVDVDGIGNANINGGDGKDIIYTDGNSTNAIWAVNFDNIRADVSGLGNSAADDLPGVQSTLAYVGGATVTVTLSGAGIRDLADGGGVMAFDDAEIGDDGYEASFTIAKLLNGRTHYGTQEDVNAAIKAAIEGDAVLNALLTVVEGANNTLAIVSKTSGDFQPTDLRIDIDQRDATSDAVANAVLTEARTVFQNSALTLNDLWGTTTFTTAAPGIYQAGAPAGEAGDLTSSVTANTWFDGLSVDGDVVSMNDNLHTAGTPSTAESDNVINGGNDDDIIVLSTDALDGTSDISGYNPFAPAFTAGGNNSMINGASNETIVLTGSDFGDDTVMNFTTAGPRTEVDGSTPTNTATVEITQQGQEEIIAVTENVPEVFTIELSAPEVGETGDVVFEGVNITVDGLTLQQLVDAFVAAGTFGPYTATAGTAPGTVVFTETTPAGVDLTPAITDFLDVPGVLVGFNGDQDGTVTTTTTGQTQQVETFTVTFGNSTNNTTYTFDGETIPVLDGQTGADIAAAAGAGVYDNWTAVAAGNVVTFTSTAAAPGDFDVTDVTNADFVGANLTDITTVSTIYSGVDFLDFGAYLTSLEDTSSNSPAGPDSSVSNTLIDVTLDYNEDNTLSGTGLGAANANLEANEVGVVRMDNTGDAGETFAALTASNVAALFNNDGSFTGFGGDSSYGDLNAANFDLEEYQKTDQEELVGNAKAIFMVENADNLGEYKVFELTWDGDQADGDDPVATVNDLGSLDFGTSLTDLGDVNLVGSAEYDALIAGGFAAIV